MSNKRFIPEFKQEAIRQIVDRGHSVSEVSARIFKEKASLDEVKFVLRDEISRIEKILYTHEELKLLTSYSSLMVNLTRIRAAEVSRGIGSECLNPAGYSVSLLDRRRSRDWDTSIFPVQDFGQSRQRQASA